MGFTFLVIQLQKTDFTIIEIMALIPTGNYHEILSSEKIRIIKLPKVVFCYVTKLPKAGNNESGLPDWTMLHICP